MRYCPDCGTGHDCEVATEGRADPAVEIARINADRDVAVAKLQARMQREELATVEEVTELEADVAVEVAVAEAEVLGAVLNSDSAAEPEPIVIDAPTIVSDDQAVDAPPPVEGSEPPAPKGKGSGIGFW